MGKNQVKENKEGLICEDKEDYHANSSKPNYAEQIFTIINEENKDIISIFCEAIFSDSLLDEEISFEAGNNSEINEKNIVKEYIHGKEFLEDFLSRLPKPITVVQELYYIDRSFRDTYYMYFSNQHFQIKRYSKRLSFFRGEYSEQEFFCDEEKAKFDLENAFIGACVINPIVIGAIGRTLIAPKYAFSSVDLPVYMRLSRFELNIYGRTFYVDAFPYRMQDQETMCCAEITLLNMLEYYANSYNDYKLVVPNEIIDSEQKHNHERVLPARGVTYPVLTKVFSEFGFSPRLYNISAMESYCYSHFSQEDEIKRWLHYYIESGIPVAVNLAPVGFVGAGHSIVCIGHGAYNKNLKKVASKKRWISWADRENAHPIIDSADFYDSYVIVDDNQPIYQLRNFEQLSVYSDMRVENLAIPLYKRMFMDAPNAHAAIRSLLNSEQYGINKWAEDFLNHNENVVIRVFMASSSGYKDFRTSTIKDIYIKQLYALIPMPKFVWVCELYRENDYDDLMAFGEIVIDATSAPNKGHKSLIMMRYPNVIAYRHPMQNSVGFEDIVKLNDGNDNILFNGYRKNLTKIE